MRPPGRARTLAGPPPYGEPGTTPDSRPAVPHWLGVVFATLVAGAALLVSAAPGLAATLSEHPARAVAQDTEGIDVAGTLRNDDGELLTNVTVEVLDDTGATVTEAQTDADGRWEVLIPQAGEYTFRIDESTLPDGVQVLQGSVEREVAEDRLSAVIFRFGEERTGLGSSDFSRVLRLLVDGVRFGLVIGITAVGMSLIFGTTGLTNFAHGELVTIGAVVAWTVNVVGGVQLIPATLIAIVVGVGIGALNELAIWRPLRKRRSGLIAQLVVSIGLALVLRYLVLIFFGGRSQSFADYNNQVERDYGLFSLTDKDVATIVISAVVLVGIAVLLQRTRIGKAMRAVSDNRDLAASSGIDVDRVVLFVWMLGGGLCGLGGVLFALSEFGATVQFEMGFRLLLLMFAGVILGGLGTAYGALVGCLIVGVLVQMSTLVIPVDLKYLGGLAVLVVILVFRPQGLLGSRARIG